MSVDVATAPAAAAATVASAAAASSSEGSNGGVPRRVCPLCGKPGIKVCSGCSKVGYCSKEHQVSRTHQQHTLTAPSHETDCETPSIQQNEHNAHIQQTAVERTELY